MASVEARFEFRLFTLAGERDRLDTVLTDLLGQGSEPMPGQAVYLLKRALDSVNFKLRDGKLDIKRLVRHQAGLQQWRPERPSGFPLGPETRLRLQNTYGFPESLLTAADVASFLTAAETDSELLTVHVRKQRRHFRRGDLLGETVLITANGAQLASLALESTDPVTLRQALAAVGLAREENVSYPLVLQRVCAMVPLPPEHPWRVGAI